jgi:hypothetical protein
MNPHKGRCIPSDENPVAAGDGGVDGGATVDGSLVPSDPGGNDPDPGIDGPGPDAGMDAAIDAPPGDPDHDAGLDGGDVYKEDAGEGGAPDTDAGMACDSDDIADWKAFHTQQGMVQQILSCAGNPTCDGLPCEFDACMRAAADVQSCDRCVADEASCMFSACAEACGARGSDDQCRACACENGCTDAFATCSGADMADVCADCSGDTCTNMSVLSPELIMVILHPVLAAQLLPLPVTP